MGDNLFHLEGVDEMNVMSVTLHFSGFRDHDSDVETRCCKWIIKFNWNICITRHKSYS